jgi:hypothetical protein
MVSRDIPKKLEKKIDDGDGWLSASSSFHLGKISSSSYETGNVSFDSR